MLLVFTQDGVPIWELRRRACGRSPHASAVKQQNANNGMTLKFVKYLYGSTLECSFAQRRRKMPGIVFLRAFSEKAESEGDSHAGTNMIQASCWEEASMDGEAVFGGLACTRNRRG